MACCISECLQPFGKRKNSWRAGLLEICIIIVEVIELIGSEAAELELAKKYCRKQSVMNYRRNDGCITDGALQQPVADREIGGDGRLLLSENTYSFSMYTSGGEDNHPGLFDYRTNHICVMGTTIKSVGVIASLLCHKDLSPAIAGP